ncbi:MAG: hypothetical protein R2755_14125 [Acidimicrobiales bacterium]
MALIAAFVAHWLAGVVDAQAANKVTICHRTHSTTNPYRRISVGVSAVNGSSNNDHTHHTGAVFDPATQYPPNQKIWGDIIPNQASGGGVGSELVGRRDQPLQRRGLRRHVGAGVLRPRGASRCAGRGHPRRPR